MPYNVIILHSPNSQKHDYKPLFKCVHKSIVVKKWCTDSLRIAETDEIGGFRGAIVLAT